MASNDKNWFLRLLFVLLAAALLTQACIELNRVAWGTGIWLGEYSPKWAIGFFGFILLSLGLFASILTLVYSTRMVRGLQARSQGAAIPQ